MSKLRRKRISFIARLRNYFITGIVVLVPIGITLYLTTFFISISSKLIPQGINPNSYLPFAIPGLEILLSVIFITFVGGLSLSFIGKKFLQLFNDLLKKIPILRTIYSAIGQMTETLAPKSGSSTTRRRPCGCSARVKPRFLPFSERGSPGGLFTPLQSPSQSAAT